MAWQCQDTTCSGFAPQRTDTKGDGKEMSDGAGMRDGKDWRRYAGMRS